PRWPRPTSCAAAARCERGGRRRRGRASMPACRMQWGRTSPGCARNARDSGTSWEGRAAAPKRGAPGARHVDRWEDEALVLSTRDYGEAYRLVTLLTRTRGKLTAFAAGARKSRRRFAGALEPGTLLRARLVERHGTTARLDAVDVLRGFGRIRDELPRIARALYALELCREPLRDAEPAPELFTLAVEWLGRLHARHGRPTPRPPPR